MTKKLVIAGIALVACAFVAKKTHFCSYAHTMITQGREHVRQQIPRSFELADVSTQIKKLDRDYNNMLGPIAEKKASIKRLEREVAAGQASLAEQREALVALAKAVEAKESQISYQGLTFKLDRATKELSRGWTNYKKLEVTLKTKETLLDAEQQFVAASLDQLDKMVSQKREFETRLAQLQANESIIQASKVSSPVKSDEGRIAEIKNALDQIEQSQAIEKERRLLEQQFGPRIGDALPNVDSTPVDVNAILEHLTGRVSTTTKAAQGSK